MFPFKFTEEQRQWTIESYKNGMPVAKIAEELGCANATIYNIMRKSDLTPNRRKDYVDGTFKRREEKTKSTPQAEQRKFIPPKPKTPKELYPGLVEDYYDNRGNIPYWLASLRGGYNVMSRDRTGDFEVHCKRFKSLDRAIKFWKWHVRLFDEAFEGVEMEECDG